jgi:hypothetical protein
MTTPRNYARVYHGIVDDPRFDRVYHNDAALATWLRMLLVADAMYPTSAPMPRRNPTVSLLIDSGLVEERPGHRYVIHGLEAERERRSASARIGAAVRWQSERTANGMPSKAEQNKAEQNNGANAPKSDLPNGNAMGYRPKEPGVWGGAGTHDGRHGESCQGCAPLATPSQSEVPSHAR